MVKLGATCSLSLGQSETIVVLEDALIQALLDMDEGGVSEASISRGTS